MLLNLVLHIVSLQSLTMWTCGYFISELVVINPYIRDYFTAVAFLHVVKRLAKYAINDELLDVHV